MLKNWSLKKRLLGYALLNTAFLLTAGLIGFHALKSVAEPYTIVAENNIPKLNAVSHMFLAQKDIVIAVSELVGKRTTPEEVSKAQKEIDTSLAHLTAAQKEYESKYRSEEENTVYQEAIATVEPVVSGARKIADLSLNGTEADDQARDRFAKTVYVDARKAFRHSFGALIDMQQKRTKLRVEQAETAQARAEKLVTANLLLGGVLALALGFAISQALSRALTRLASQLSQGADEVASASNQLSATSEELSAASAQQAASIQETSASVQEISSMISRNSDNAAACESSSSRSQDLARRGQTTVDEMVAAITEIDEANTQVMKQVEDSNAQIARIVRMIREIGDKTKVINDIVFQTKLLSFNASVEAARAAEHGKGFAVVAEEVGNLARMSGNAATEISSLLESSIREVDGIVESSKEKVARLIEMGRAKVEAGKRVADGCGQVLTEIVESSSSMTTSITDIATACSEQSRGTQEISRAMAQLDQVTQQNSSASEEAANAATELSNQADVLRASVAELAALIHGASELHQMPPPPSTPRPTPRQTPGPLDTRKTANARDPRFKDVA